MNLDELRAVQVDERSADSLKPLRDSFYRDVAAYIEELRGERERAAERADNPFDSEEVRRLTDEIETAEEVVEAIYERRVGKVVKRASLAAAGMPTDDEGLTDEEAELFSELVSLIEANRGKVLSAFEHDASASSPGSTSPSTDSELSTPPEPEREPSGSGEPDPSNSPAPEPGASGLDAGDAMGGRTEASPPTSEAPPASEEGSAGTASGRGDPVENERMAESTPPGGVEGGTPAGTDRVTIRITREVGEIFGVDERVYRLGAEDVVTLPEENAKPLLDRDAAQKL